jgi:protein gp37
LLSTLDFNTENRWGTGWNVLTGRILDAVSGPSSVGGVHWVIAGGESGPGARPMHPDWARSLRDQCAAAGVAFHFKQHGDWIEHEHALNAVGDDDPRVSDGRQRMRRDNGGLMVAHDTTFIRLGKKDAGRLLDGREHNEFPR